MRGAHQLFIVFIWIAVMSLPGAALAQLAPAQLVPFRPVAAGADKLPPTMRFKYFVINDDPTYTGMEIERGIMPADWTLKGGVVWDLRDARPAQFRIHISDPQDVAAFDVYPNQFFYWSAQAQRNPGGVDPNFRYMGELIRRPPVDQFEAINQAVVQRFRPDLVDAKVVEKTKLMDVAKADFDSMPKFPGGFYEVMAGKMTFEYDLRGQTVQEEMYAVYEKATNQRFGYMNWTVLNVTSTRGINGSLNQLNMIRAVLARSCRPNIEWTNKITQFVVMRNQNIVQQLNDAQRRREAFAKITSDINDQSRQDFEKHMQDIDRQSDAQADYMREVSPWKTGDGGTVKLPNQYGHAWEGADGTILMGNNAQYDPNSDPNTHTRWTEMQQVPR